MEKRQRDPKLLSPGLLPIRDRSFGTHELRIPILNRFGETSTGSLPAGRGYFASYLKELASLICQCTGLFVKDQNRKYISTIKPFFWSVIGVIVAPGKASLSQAMPCSETSQCFK